MNLWTSVWTNNPYDDYNLVIEISYNGIDNDVARIQQSQHELIFKWYIDPKGLVIPIDWLLMQLLEAKRDMLDSTKIKENIINKWTSIWKRNVNDDQNIICSILCDDDEVAMIKQNEQELILKWCASPKGLIMSVDWLVELFLYAKNINIQNN